MRLLIKLNSLFIIRTASSNVKQLFFDDFQLRSADPSRSSSITTDGAPSHKAEETQNLIRDNMPEFIEVDIIPQRNNGEWPPNSPNLNVMDYSIWSILEAEACSKPHQLIDALKKSLVKAWNAIPQEVIDRTVDDLPKRLKKCVEAGSGNFETADGYLAVGYDTIHIDDCWEEWKRSVDGKLVANRTRFPSGINGLSKYMHDRGLKLGIYNDVGLTTCQGYPGGFGNEEIDAQTYADWGVDYLKYDGCFANDSMRNVAWSSIIDIIDHFVMNQGWFIYLPTGPGFFIDADMIVAGNPEITQDQARVQMSIWSIWSAPLIMSNDLRNITPGHKEILQNKYVIAVDQDPMGLWGKMIGQVTFECSEFGTGGPYI
uniref:Alpha-galactosidase n=1 Tax=Acrobeloides nanus TaxID=290746 RepID=A0A914CM50_9BILA